MALRSSLSYSTTNIRWHTRILSIVQHELIEGTGKWEERELFRSSHADIKPEKVT